MKPIKATAFLFVLFTCHNGLAEDVSKNSSMAAKEWRSYIEPMLPLGEEAVALMSDPQDPQLRQEVYQRLFSRMSQAYMGLFLGDTEHPDFWPLVNQAYNNLMPNPDDTYYLAPIDGMGEYRISGFRGTVHTIDVQIGSGNLLPQGSGTLQPNLASHDLDKLDIGKDGFFSVIISKDRPSGYKGDWWPLAASASYVLVRQVSYDWMREIDGRFAIERLDRPAVRPRPAAAEIEKRLRNIPDWVTNWSKIGPQWTSRNNSNGYVNKLRVYSLTDLGGVSSQQYIDGNFQLEPGEALIYETRIPEKCSYWNIQIGDTQWATIDYTNRQTSLNGFTATLDDDGRFRAVISETDPGVPNWLDSAGYSLGTLMGRWKDCSSNPTPTLKRVKLTEVRQHLPEDTPVISAEEREASLRLRRVGAQLRRRW